MIKFGNDIVTVGGDWLKIIPTPVKIAEYPLQQITIPKRVNQPTYQYVFPLTDVPVTDYAVLKVACTEMNGAIRLSAGQNDGWVEIDYTSRDPQIIDCVNMWVNDLIAYDGTVSSKQITLSNWHIIDRIIFDFTNSKVYFYNRSTRIAEGTMTKSASRYTPWNAALLNVSTAYQATCNVSGEIWQCFTMEQALSV